MGEAYITMKFQKETISVPYIIWLTKKKEEEKANRPSVKIRTTGTQTSVSNWSGIMIIYNHE